MQKVCNLVPKSGPSLDPNFRALQLPPRVSPSLPAKLPPIQGWTTSTKRSNPPSNTLVLMRLIAKLSGGSYLPAQPPDRQDKTRWWPAGSEASPWRRGGGSLFSCRRRFVALIFGKRQQEQEKSSKGLISFLVNGGQCYVHQDPKPCSKLALKWQSQNGFGVEVKLISFYEANHRKHNCNGCLQWKGIVPSSGRPMPPCFAWQTISANKYSTGSIREEILWKKTFSFGHCPKNGGGGSTHGRNFWPSF